MRILIRTSKWAILARRLGGLAVPLVVLPVLMHRERLMDSPSFHIVALVAFAVAALALLVSLIAIVRLWYTGDQGWGRAIAGLFLVLICLTPFGYYGSLALRYPLVTDIATVQRGDLPLIFDTETAAMPPPYTLMPDEQALYFPNAASRAYPIAPADLFALAERIVLNNGWDIRRRSEPQADQPGPLNARIETIPGWREEAVLRVSSTPQGAAIDMRSASLNAPHDFGSNGNRISAFMVALDTDVTAFIRDNPNAPPPEPDDDSPEVETGAE